MVYYSVVKNEIPLHRYWFEVYVPQGRTRAISLAAALPGFVATTVSLAYLFLRSTLPIHRRIKALKHKELQKISRAISEARSGWSGSPSQELISLLNYRG